MSTLISHFKTKTKPNSGYGYSSTVASLEFKLAQIWWYSLEALTNEIPTKNIHKRFSFSTAT